VAELDKLIQVKEVNNSSLKMGYNEEDYVCNSTQYPNCLHEHISPAGWQRKEKFIKPT
jgi:hypothetical protein